MPASHSARSPLIPALMLGLLPCLLLIVIAAYQLTANQARL
jgi:hypothetical protein